MNEIFDIIKKKHGTIGEELVKKAHNFSKEAHANQKRADGKLFITHPENVVRILIKHGHTEPELIAAALLHDVVEDTIVSLEMIKNEFGEQIAFLVDGVTDIGKGDGETPLEDKYERMSLTQEKILEFGLKDNRIFLIKTADRIHNLRTMDVLPEESKKRIAKEAKTFHKKIAKDLGEKNFVEIIDSLVEDYLDS